MLNSFILIHRSMQICILVMRIWGGWWMTSSASLSIWVKYAAWSIAVSIYVLYNDGLHLLHFSGAGNYFHWVPWVYFLYRHSSRTGRKFSLWWHKEKRKFNKTIEQMQISAKCDDLFGNVNVRHHFILFLRDSWSLYKT